MLPRSRCNFFFLSGGGDQESVIERKSTNISSSAVGDGITARPPNKKSSSVYPTGLRILIQCCSSAGLGSEPPNIVFKSAMTLTTLTCRRKTTPRTKRAPPATPGKGEFSFLKSCHLCQKRLSPNKDVFMYRGEGFCSVECRSRQMFLDEMREIEASTKSMLSSSSSSSSLCRSSRRVQDSGGRRRRLGGLLL